MRDFIESVTQRYLDYLSKGTMAEGAKVIFRQVPASAVCHECHSIFDFDWRSETRISCPNCKQTNAELKTGAELEVEAIVIVRTE